MEIAATHASVIVRAVLTKDTYKTWSILMRHYLMGQNLWHTVESSQFPAEGYTLDQWITKNALALHVIKFSCGEEIFDQIKEMDSAKDVWDVLADMHKPQIVRTDTFTALTFGNLGRSQYETLTKAISNGAVREVRDIFAHNPDAKSARIFENGYTALHFSVYSRKERIVDYLIDSNLSKEELEIKDNYGSTALSIAARFGVGKSIAQKLVGKNRNLLTIPDNDGKIPVQLACSTIHDEDVARYLYVVTPQESLEGDCGFYILQECIIRKMFDIAFDLLHHFPKMASQSCSLGSIPLILTLAQTQPPFFRGNNLPFWERRIYDCIRVKAYFLKEDEHRSCDSCVQNIQDFYQSCKEMIPDLFQRCGWLSLPIVGYRPGITLGDCSVVPALRVVLGIFLGIFLVMPVVLMLSMPLILGILILGALRILVSMLLRCFARDLYQQKLMDEYAREVIRLICGESLSELDQNQFVQSRAVEATFQAIKNGIPDMVKKITIANVNILRWNIDPEDSMNIFACAVAHRQEEVARFLYELPGKDTNMVTTIDKDKNNILHLAAKLAPPYQSGCISGSVLRLQSELRWFKGVEEIVPRSYRECKNSNGETPLKVFGREHTDLLKEAEEWGKKTAESSTVVGALIITIMFAVAFTVPGGNDQSRGFPILLHETPIPFMIFMVSDALSLFAASTSVMIFLGILTSHQADEDYRKYSLVITGLTYLFLSIATMTIAFCAALFIMLQGRLVLVIPITVVAGIPIKWFVQLQFPLLIEIFCLNLRPNIFGRRETSWMSKGQQIWSLWA